MLEDFDWDELFRLYEAQKAQRELRRDNPYVKDIIEVLIRYPSGV